MKLKILLVILMLIIGISPSFAQTTPTAVITGTATTIIGPGGTIYPVSLQAQLVGCQQQVPTVPGGSIVQTYYTQSAPPSAYTATITAYGNDVVTCGTQNYTTYAVTWLINNQPAAPTATYRIVQGATCNISNGTCKPINFIPAVISKGAGLFCPSGQILNGFNADYTPSCQAFTGSLIPPFLTNSVANTVQSSLNITGTNGVAASSSGATVTLDGSALTRLAPTSNQTITQPVNTNSNFVTSGSGQLQYNGSEVAKVSQIPSITGLVQLNPAGPQTITGKVTSNGFCTTAGPYNARACGTAKGDANALTCSIGVSSNILTCGGTFTTADVGKEMYVQGAGAAGATLKTTISSFVNSSSVILANIAVTAASSVTAFYASDDTFALQSAYIAAKSNGRALYIPFGVYLHHGLNFTQSAIDIFGDGQESSVLIAMAVTNPGRINTTNTVGVDLSGTGFNSFKDIVVSGGFTGFTDMAPNVNFYAARIGPNGSDFAIQHSIRNVRFTTFGPYDVYLYGYEQTTFEDCIFQNNTTSLGVLTFAAQNTAGRASPYFTTLTAPISMTKAAVYGGKTTFAINSGKGVVFDQGGGQGNQSISIRDSFIVMSGSGGTFVSDTGGSPLKLMEFRSDYAEMNTCTTCKMFDITAAAWDWQMTNINVYNTVGSFSSAQFNFAGGFLDSYAQIDQAVSVGGISFNASSCFSSILQLGHDQPTASCTDFAMRGSFGGAAVFNNGPTTTVVIGGCTMGFVGGVLNSKAGC